MADLGWARDLVMVALRRAGEDGLGKVELQEETGLGAADLRVMMADLEESGEVRGTEQGWVAVELDPEDPEEGPEEGPEESEEEASESEESPVAPQGADVQQVREVVLTAGMMEALSNDALGEMIRAGADDAAEEGRVFILAVEQ